MLSALLLGVGKLRKTLDLLKLRLEGKRELMYPLGGRDDWWSLMKDLAHAMIHLPSSPAQRA